MDLLWEINSYVNNFVWGWPVVSLLVFAGVFLMVGLKFLPWSKLSRAVSYAFSKQEKQESDEGVSPRAALFTAMAATVGTGNIAGVATAIYFGGPGALFYMWVMALIGMATKYTEVALAVHFRETNEKNEFVGGPMYYIKNGLKDRLPMLASVLAVAYAIFGAFSALFTGGSIQSHAIVSSINETLNVSIGPLIGVVITVLAALVVIGGIKRIAEVADKLVPTMIVLYIVGGIATLIIFAGKIPAAFYSVFAGAFGIEAAAGGVAGSAVATAISYGFRRGIFSNEAGLGTAAIAHASSNTKSPIHQGMISVLGVFIDTILVCTFTGLVIIVSGTYSPGGELNGAALTTASFAAAFTGGGVIVSICLSLFAFTTILGWALYGERCIGYLFKNSSKAVLAYRSIFLICVYIGSVASLDKIWGLSDTANGLMSIPNLVALILLGPLVFKLSKDAKKELL